MKLIKKVTVLIAIIIVSAVVGWFLHFRNDKTRQTHIDLETNRKVVAEYDRDGKLDGQTFAYKDQKLVASAEFKHGLKDGISTMYFPNGKKESVSHYVRDKEEGERIVYRQNGRIKSIDNWSGGKLYGNTYQYHENGKLKCYNARDIKETVFYTYGLNEAGILTRNDGQVISKNLYSLHSDSIIILKSGHRYQGIKDLYVTTSSPPGTITEIEARVNQEKSIVVKIDSNTYRIRNAFISNKRHLVKIVGRFKDRNNRTIKVDSLNARIFVD